MKFKLIGMVSRSAYDKALFVAMIGVSLITFLLVILQLAAERGLSGG